MLLLLLTVLCACAPRGDRTTIFVAGEAVNPGKLTAAEIEAKVAVVPRGDRLSFQAPPIESITDIDLRDEGRALGLELGTVERVRVGYLFGVLERPTGTLRHYLLFQSNFIEGHDRYAAVALRDGTTLEFGLSRVPDPCVPNCFPTIEALIVDLPDALLRAQAANGLQLDITLDTGDVIHIGGSPAYVQGYLAAVDAHR